MNIMMGVTVYKYCAALDNMMHLYMFNMLLRIFIKGF